VLCESGLLPGVLIRNESLKFICKEIYLKTENAQTAFTNGLKPGEIIKVPVAHGEGNFMVTDEVLQDLETNKQVVFRYSGPQGEITNEFNINGSRNNIAGIVSKEGNVFGMMPHPERACESILGSADGLKILNSIRESVRQRVAA
jgi:phosphoribosylformylglycinamidine synthase subunit PurQ / glutaminase